MQKPFTDLMADLQDNKPHYKEDILQQINEIDDPAVIPAYTYALREYLISNPYISSNMVRISLSGLSYHKSDAGLFFAQQFLQEPCDDLIDEVLEYCRKRNLQILASDILRAITHIGASEEAILKTLNTLQQWTDQPIMTELKTLENQSWLRKNPKLVDAVHTTIQILTKKPA